MDELAEVDVLALMEIRQEKVVLGGEEEEINSLGFLDWLRFDAWQMDFLSALGKAEVPAMIVATNRMLDQATGVSPAGVFVGEALVAFPIVLELNTLQFIDPALLARQPKTYRDTAVVWKNRMVLDFVGTLVRRFSMQEIREMQPAFALLMWQHIREEEAVGLDVVFYSSEMGYKRQGSGKSAKLVPRESPFAPFWVKGKRGRIERVLPLPSGPEPLSPFVTQPGRVVDMGTGKRLRREEAESVAGAGG